MYECSCVDFAVHATVCKHVHTIHALRSSAIKDAEPDQDDSHMNNDMQKTSTTDEEPILAADDELLNGEATSAEDLVDDHNDGQMTINGDDDRMMIHGVMSDIRQITAMVSTGSFHKDDFLAFKKHISAAKACLQVASIRKPDPLKTIRKMPASKKLDKQFRFRCVRHKRQPTTSTIRKPDATTVANVRQFLLTSGRQTGDAMSTTDTDRPAVGDGCDQIPYCVDTEELHNT